MERWKILHSAKDLKQKKRNVKRSADVSGNARHFCDGELNFTPEFNYRIREKALRNESLETNNAKECLQSCGCLSKWTSFLPFRVQLKDVRHPTSKDKYTKKEPPPSGSFPLQYSFLINQHMKFLYGLRMHKLTRLRFLHQSSSQQMILTNDG